MTTPTRWSAETEELVARALHAAEHAGWRSCAEEPAHEQTSWFVDRCRLVLMALADAGVLIPPGGETRQEWAVRVDEPHPKRTEKAGDYLPLRGGEQIARYGPRIWAGWVPVFRTHHIGPWREVTDDPA